MEKNKKKTTKVVNNVDIFLDTVKQHQKWGYILPIVYE